MSERERVEIVTRLNIIDRHVRSVMAMVQSGRPEQEILAQLKAIRNGVAAMQRVLLTFVTERMLRYAATLPGAERVACVNDILAVRRRFED